MKTLLRAVAGCYGDPQYGFVFNSAVVDSGIV
jgi:hypothetical protein